MPHGDLVAEVVALEVVFVELLMVRLHFGESKYGLKNKTKRQKEKGYESERACRKDEREKMSSSLARLLNCIGTPLIFNGRTQAAAWKYWSNLFSRYLSTLLAIREGLLL